MLPILLALVAALAYGVSDYIAGLATRRLPATVVTLVATLGALARPRSWVPSSSRSRS